jgi:radical SAM family uncharacterized protein/radical SAM-linked protein
MHAPAPDPAAALPWGAAHPYAEIFERVEKPARYTGGEVGAVVKDWAAAEATVCLAFPDVYDIGMSHLGFKILYKVLNDDPRTLAERCYCPWVDMEAELRARALPLVSLESARPLRDFDVVGFSLQFELTYSNILTMLDLGGIPLRAADRGEDDPLVLAGGPTATHPEPLAPFLDALVIGDGEAKCTEVALLWARLRREGVPRADRLVAIARLGAVYVPALYATKLDPDSGLEVVDRAQVEGAPLPVERALVNLDDYPFPDDGPTGGPEAIFDRMSIEIARGCTEGCRFCQAGMIYRPVRERDPAQIVETVLSAVKKSGQDEVSLTALSTADVSCISPLIKQVAGRLAEERVTLGVSSLRAYGLEPELLDELSRVRATGLTFAPEAGTQRMRDVVNKNVTEEQLLETAGRVFTRGWGRMKLYFMIGLPTETDEDVRGIVETGIRTMQHGKRSARGKAVDVTVSVSTHVPKPHTPFQWCAMDTLDEVDRKQRLLREAAQGKRALKLRTHGSEASVLEGVFARGDRRLADVLERAWRNGARFDSWDERLDLEVWKEAFAHFGVDTAPYLGTIPIDARLPWDHIDVGLEDGFLAREYRKALQSRLSPPCGKVAGTFVHHTNTADAEADARRLVCYDCGVACDMSQMREERLVFLRRLDKVREERPVIAATPHRPAAPGRPQPRQDPAHVAAASAPLAPALDEAAELAAPGDAEVVEAPPPRQGTTPRPGARYRFRFEKTGPVALLGHLDLVRALPRIFRRVEEAMVYTNGFHPKPDMSFAPALGLGVMSLCEFVDIRLHADLDEPGLAALVQRMNAASPRGLLFTGAARLAHKDPAVTRVIRGARYLLAFARTALPPDAEGWLADRCRAAVAASTLPLRREIEGIGRTVDVRKHLVSAVVAGPEAREALARAGLFGDMVAVDVLVTITPAGAAKPSELARVIAGEGDETPPHRAVRLELFGGDAAGERWTPLDAVRARAQAQAEAARVAVLEAAALEASAG